MAGGYVEESPGGPGIDPAVERVAFVGRSRRGPRHAPVRVAGLAEFDATFGSRESTLRRAVAAYLTQGGDPLLVVRGPDLTAALGALDDAAPTLLVVAPPLLRGREAEVHAWCVEHRCFLLAESSDGTIPPGLGENAAAYAPRLRDPSGRRVWAAAAVAGVVRRTDVARGVWTVPAGQDAYVDGLTTDPPPADPAANLIRSDLPGPPLVWGARTASGDPEWKYVNIRRFFLFLERSIDEGLRWAVFEPNDEALWARVRQAVSDFLHPLWRQGALPGVTPDEAYFVRCDRTTMTQNDLDNGRLDRPHRRRAAAAGGVRDPPDPAADPRRLPVMSEPAKPRRDRPASRTPSMMPLVWQVIAAVAVAVVGAALLYLFLAWLLDLPFRPKKSGQQERLADLVKVALGLAAGVGASVALIVGYRKARVEEAASHRDDQRLFDDRYQSASQLLGHDTAAVRLAGIYAIARLADDWAEQRQQCIDVLCAYLRLPFDPEIPEGGEVELRLSLVRLIVGHLVPDAEISWCDQRFDFSRAVFDGCDFGQAVFDQGVSFTNARFVGADTTFDRAVFGRGADFDGCELDGVRVDFTDVEFKGQANFSRARLLPGSTLRFTASTFRQPLWSWGSTIEAQATLSLFGCHLVRGVHLNGSQVAGSVTFEQTAFGDPAHPGGARAELDEDVFTETATVAFSDCLFACEVVLRSTLKAVITFRDSDLSRCDRVRVLSTFDGGGVSFAGVPLGGQLILEARKGGTGSVDLMGLALTESAPEPSIVLTSDVAVRTPTQLPREPDPGPEPPMWSTSAPTK